MWQRLRIRPWPIPLRVHWAPIDHGTAENSHGIIIRGAKANSPKKGENVFKLVWPPRPIRLFLAERKMRTGTKF